MCMDADAFKIANSLGTPGSGYEYLNMILTYCDEAAAMLNYTDPNCSNDRSVSEMYFGMYNFKFDTKFVTQFFDPVQYR